MTFYSMLHGYAGKVLRVDLTTGKIVGEPVDEALARKFIGGTGYAAKILWDELQRGIDPLGPDNLLIAATGPLTGTLTPCSGSVEFCFKSPLTNIFGESRAGGTFGPKLRFAGYDLLIIKGKSDKPVYLRIFNDDVELKDASHLWGKTVHEATDIILEEEGNPNASVACIGPGGERSIKFANIMVDYDRAAGRCGGGAVMGSKNLKAIVVDGDKGISVADPEKFYEAALEALEALKKRHGERLSRLGTLGGLTGLNEEGALPTKNFQTCYFEEAERVSGEALARKYLLKRRACFGCPIGCGRYVWVPGGRYQTPPHEGAEYETVDMIAVQTLMGDLEVLMKASYLCNTYGIDTISAGNSIAFAIEAYERRLITKEDTGGLELRWDDPDAVLALLEKIIERKDIGDLLAEGVRKAAEKIGGVAEEFACHGKGLEVPAHDTRGTTKSLAIQYAVGNPRGACHVEPIWPGMWDYSETDMGLREFGLPWPPPSRFEELGVKRGTAYKIMISFGELAGVLGLCMFALISSEEKNLNIKRLSRLMSTLTGWNLTPPDLLTVGERAYTLKRCFNVREGITRKDDKIPKRLMDPLTSGPTKGVRVENLDGMLDEFYDAVGWDRETGAPKKELLLRLELSDVAEKLWSGSL